MPVCIDRLDTKVIVLHSPRSRVLMPSFLGDSTEHGLGSPCAEEGLFLPALYSAGLNGARLPSTSDSHLMKFPVVHDARTPTEEDKGALDRMGLLVGENYKVSRLHLYHDEETGNTTWMAGMPLVNDNHPVYFIDTTPRLLANPEEALPARPLDMQPGEAESRLVLQALVDRQRELQAKFTLRAYPKLKVYLMDGVCLDIEEVEPMLALHNTWSLPIPGALTEDGIKQFVQGKQVTFRHVADSSDSSDFNDWVHNNSVLGYGVDIVSLCITEIPSRDLLSAAVYVMAEDDTIDDPGEDLEYHAKDGHNRTYVVPDDIHGQAKQQIKVLLYNRGGEALDLQVFYVDGSSDETEMENVEICASKGCVHIPILLQYCEEAQEYGSWKIVDRHTARILYMLTFIRTTAPRKRLRVD
jgi:hypothetical protein